MDFNNLKHMGAVAIALAVVTPSTTDAETQEKPHQGGWRDYVEPPQKPKTPPAAATPAKAPPPEKPAAKTPPANAGHPSNKASDEEDISVTDLVKGAGNVVGRATGHVVAGTVTFAEAVGGGIKDAYTEDRPGTPDASAQPSAGKPSHAASAPPHTGAQQHPPAPADARAPVIDPTDPPIIYVETPQELPHAAPAKTAHTLPPEQGIVDNSPFQVELRVGSQADLPLTFSDSSASEKSYVTAGATLGPVHASGTASATLNMDTQALGGTRHGDLTLDLAGGSFAPLSLASGEYLNLENHGRISLELRAAPPIAGEMHPLLDDATLMPGASAAVQLGHGPIGSVVGLEAKMHLNEPHSGAHTVHDWQALAVGKIPLAQDASPLKFDIGVYAGAEGIVHTGNPLETPGTNLVGGLSLTIRAATTPDKGRE